MTLALRREKRRYWVWILGLLLMLAATPLQASTFQWTGADNLNPAWNNSVNWTLLAGAGSFPDAPDDVAQFTAGFAYATSLTLGQPITVGEIDFGSSQSFTISPGPFGSLTFASTSKTPLLINAGAGGFRNTGDDIISAPITIGTGQEQLPPNLQIVTGGGNLTLSGGVGGQGGLNAGIGAGSNLLVAKPGDSAYGASYAGPTYVQYGVLEMHNVLLSNTITVEDDYATLNLAGLTSGANRANIKSDSPGAPGEFGLVVSGTHQQVGNVDGAGTTQVNAGSDLTANHIIQSALVIGGTATNHGLVTIDASDASGNPLVSLALLAAPNTDAPVSVGGELDNSLNDGPVAESSTSLPPSANAQSAAVPEPSSLFLLAVGGLAVAQTVLRRSMRPNWKGRRARRAINQG
jgi:hypothetical protein